MNKIKDQKKMFNYNKTNKLENEEDKLENKKDIVDNKDSKLKKNILNYKIQKIKQLIKIIN
jgi:hypothetical protein